MTGRAYPRAITVRPARSLPGRPDLPGGPTGYTRRAIPATWWLRPIADIAAGLVAALRREQQEHSS
jgi:hypothetical protein